MKNLKRLFETGTERVTERMYTRDLKQRRDAVNIVREKDICTNILF